MQIEEPTIQEAVDILSGIAPKYEEHHQVTITQDAIKAAVSARYINDRNLPDKAIDVMDEAAATVRLKNMKSPEKLNQMEEEIAAMDNELEECLRNGDLQCAAKIRKEQEKLVKKYQKAKSESQKKQTRSCYEIGEMEIAAVVSAWTKIPLNKLTEKESERLLKLEEILHKRVIGQEAAVKQYHAQSDEEE